MSTPSELTGVGGHSFTLTRFKLPKGHCSGESRSWCFAVYLDHWLSDIESNVVLRRHDFGAVRFGWGTIVCFVRKWSLELARDSKQHQKEP
jgi:hypothetical protein